MYTESSNNINLQQQIVHLVHWNYQPNPKDEQSKIRNETDIPCTTTSNNWKSYTFVWLGEYFEDTASVSWKEKTPDFFNMQYWSNYL